MYLGKTTDAVQPNDSEIAEVRYVTPAELDNEMKASPACFTPWFQQEWTELKTTWRERLERYCSLL